MMPLVAMANAASVVKVALAGGLPRSTMGGERSKDRSKMRPALPHAHLAGNEPAKILRADRPPSNATGSRMATSRAREVGFPCGARYFRLTGFTSAAGEPARRVRGPPAAPSCQSA